MELKRPQKGFALIFVMVFIALIMGIAGDVIYQTQLVAKNTIMQEDQIDAEIAVRTGLDFAKLLLSLNKLASSSQSKVPLPIPKNLYNILNGQPIGAESFKDIEGLTGIDFSKMISPEIFNGLKAMKGYFVLKITSESSKLNLNLLQSTYSSTTSKALLRIFSSADMEKFLSLYNYTPEDLADNLTGYVKISTTDGALTAKVNAAFNRLGLKYQPKHAVLESLEELRRVPGFEIDEIYNMFEPYFTVWPISGPQNSLNINSAPTELVAAMMTPLGRDPGQQGWDKFDDYRAKNSFAQNSIGTFFQSNFSDFNQDKDGDDIRKNIFGTTDTVFRVECRGVSNNYEKTYMMIIQQSAAPNKSNQPPPPQDKNQSQQPPQPQQPPPPQPTTTANSDPFTVLYSRWLD